VLKNTSSRLRLKIAFNADNARHWRSSTAGGPTLRCCAPTPRSRRAPTLALLERRAAARSGQQEDQMLADLKKIKKIALLGDGDNNIALIRNILDIGEGTGAAARRP
jgi:hypothetical protein